MSARWRSSPPGCSCSSLTCVPTAADDDDIGIVDDEGNPIEVRIVTTDDGQKIIGIESGYASNYLRPEHAAILVYDINAAIESLS
jgi:hypothetical protein